MRYTGARRRDSPMGLRFMGAYCVTLDMSGRLSIPSVFMREFFIECFMALPNSTSSIRLYLPSTFDAMIEKLCTLAEFDDKAASLRGLMLGNSQLLKVDPRGRITLPRRMIEMAGLEHRVTVVGQGDCLEIMDERTWHARSSVPLDDRLI